MRNETMLEKLEGDAWVAKPVDIELLERLGAFPNLLICMGDSKWYPVGYGKHVDQFSMGLYEIVFQVSVITMLIQNFFKKLKIT